VPYSKPSEKIDFPTVYYPDHNKQPISYEKNTSGSDSAFYHNLSKIPGPSLAPNLLDSLFLPMEQNQINPKI